jgi:hypothetical protein
MRPGLKIVLTPWYFDGAPLREPGGNAVEQQLGAAATPVPPRNEIAKQTRRHQTRLIN